MDLRVHQTEMKIILQEQEEMLLRDAIRRKDPRYYCQEEHMKLDLEAMIMEDYEALKKKREKKGGSVPHQPTEARVYEDIHSLEEEEAESGSVN